MAALNWKKRPKKLASVTKSPKNKQNVVPLLGGRTCYLPSLLLMGFPGVSFSSISKGQSLSPKCFLSMLKPHSALWYQDKRSICWLRPPQTEKKPHCSVSKQQVHNTRWPREGNILQENKITCHDTPSGTFHFQPGPKCTEVCRTSVDFNRFGNMSLVPSEIISGKEYQFIRFSGHTQHILSLSFSPLRKRKVHMAQGFQTQEIKQMRGKADFSVGEQTQQVHLQNGLYFLSEHK